MGNPPPCIVPKNDLWSPKYYSLVLAAEAQVESDATAVEVTVAGRGTGQITMMTRTVVGGEIGGGVLFTMIKTVVGGAIGGGVPCITTTMMEVGVAIGGGALYTKTTRMVVVGVVEGGGVPYLKTKAEIEEMTIMIGARREVSDQLQNC